MSTMSLFTQMLMLFAMMVAGFAAFKMKVFDAAGQHQVSRIVVNILNPFLMFSALSGDRPKGGLTLSLQNLVASIAFYIFFIAASYIYYLVASNLMKKTSPAGEDPDLHAVRLEQLMIIFSNIGFFGIPVIKAVFGDGYVIYLIFYMLLYNVVMYTLGMVLATPKDQGGRISFKSMINIGTISSVIALVCYFANVPIPPTAGSFFSYMGNACIPLSMILIGGSLAQLDLKSVFTDRRVWIYTLFRNILVPGLGILLLRMLPFDSAIVKICCLSTGMPIGTLTGMVAEQCSHRGNYCNKMIAMSTIFSVLTVPLLSLLYL